MCNIFDIFIAFAGRLNNCCVDSVWGFFARHADYVLKLEENLEALKNAIGELRAFKEDLMQRVHVEEQQQMKRLAKVDWWFDRVDAAMDEGDVLLKSGIQEVRRLCLGGYCSVNCWTTSNFGKRVDKCLKELDALKATGEQFAAVTQNTPTELLAELPCDATIGTEAKFNEVWSCLGEKDVGIIGLYGIGGVGKTTLLTQVRNKFVDSCCEFLVIWIVVGKNQNSEKIQAEIGREIGVLEGSADENRMHIYNKLQKKKFVLLLDDIWERIKLKEIGIPPREKLNGSKIIFTTRSLKVCGEMLAQKKIKIETLEWKHSWELFRKYVGEDAILDDPQIRPLAETVAKRCDGLPIALITTGRAMSCKIEPWEWDHAVKILKKLVLYHQNSEMEVLNELEVEVFSLLKFSFDNLPNDKVKSCFLYCCLFPDDDHIEKSMLIDYWICEDNLEMKDRSEGYSIIGTLVRSCLLEEEGDHVKLHDVIRDMALWIERENALVMANMELTEAPPVERWKGVRRLSLMENKIEKLVQVPTCPKLATLFLSHNEDLDEINEDFFLSMGALTVLDLSETSIKKLPRSITNLVSLQYLDLTRTDIEELPIELAKLEKLKYLGLGGLRLKAKRSEKIISCLSSLQILYMSNCVYIYLEDETKEDENALTGEVSVDGEILLEELMCLKHLSSLGITIRCFSNLKRFLGDHRLTSITRGICLKGFNGVKLLNVQLLASLKYLVEVMISRCDFEEIHIGTPAIDSLQLGHINFNCLRKVIVMKCRHLHDLTWLILVPNLTNLGVVECDKLEAIISGEKLAEAVDVRCGNLKPLSKLDNVHLQDLPHLSSFYPNALPLLFLSSLTVGDCPLLKRLPLDSNSKEGCKIRIYAEEEWWEAIEWEDEATKAALLPRLRFYSGDYSFC